MHHNKIDRDYCSANSDLTPFGRSITKKTVMIAFIQRIALLSGPPQKNSHAGLFVLDKRGRSDENATHLIPRARRHH
jgi:hypothetical protein